VSCRFACKYCLSFAPKDVVIAAEAPTDVPTLLDPAISGSLETVDAPDATAGSDVEVVKVDEIAAVGISTGHKLHTKRRESQ